jgi:hypothetical protein
MPLMPNTIISAPSTGLSVLFDSTLGADAASIDSGAGGFSTSGAAIEILIMCRTSEAAVRSVISVILNNDSGTNYDRIGGVSGYGGTSLAYAEAYGDSAILLSTAGANAVANAAGQHRILIPAYGDTTFHKIMDITSGFPTATSGEGGAQFKSTRYRSTTAISRVKVSAPGGSNLLAGSRMTIFKLG